MDNEVLIVEDHADSARAVHRLVERAGHPAEVAVDGLEALSKLRIRRPSLVILDNDMPRMSGRELLHEIRNDEELKGIRVVMFTSSSRYDCEDALREGVDAFVRKPDIDSLLTEVDRLLDKK